MAARPWRYLSAHARIIGSGERIEKAATLRNRCGVTRSTDVARLAPVLAFEPLLRHARAAIACSQVGRTQYDETEHQEAYECDPPRRSARLADLTLAHRVPVKYVGAGDVALRAEWTLRAWRAARGILPLSAPNLQ